MADLDLDIRLAVFDRVAQMRDEAGLVTSHQLSEGLIYQGERIPIWSQQKGIFRPAKLREYGAALTIQTAFNGPYDDRWSPDDERLVYRYRGTDPEHPDNRALRTAMQLKRPLLYLVAVQPGVYQPIFPTYIVADDPARLSVYLVADRQGLIVPQQDIATDWPLKAYITREVKQRLHQNRFRYLVINAYSKQCAMCRLRHVPLLDAAHILEDRDERGLPHIPNGLSLCKIHHTAYDVGILGIAPDYRIHLRQDVLEEHDGPMLRHGLQEMNGERIGVPRNAAHRPNTEYLAIRFDRFRAA